MNDELPVRRANRLKNYDYATPNAYFVTFCTEDRQCLFWENPNGAWEHALSPLGQAVDEAIRSVDGVDNIRLDAWVVMPNHVHLILILTSGDAPAPHLSNVVRYIKGRVSRAAGRPIWQKSYYDHVIRNRQDLVHIRDYITQNPGKWKEDRYYMA